MPGIDTITRSRNRSYTTPRDSPSWHGHASTGETSRRWRQPFDAWSRSGTEPSNSRASRPLPERAPGRPAVLPEPMPNRPNPMSPSTIRAPSPWRSRPTSWSGCWDSN